MAKFTYFIRERVKLDGVERGTNFETSITGINYADSRTMSIPSGSITTQDISGFYKDSSGNWQISKKYIQHQRLKAVSTEFLALL
jgi:hypothetical protein